MEVTLQGRGRERMGRDGRRKEEEGYGVGSMSVSEESTQVHLIDDIFNISITYQV